MHNEQVLQQRFPTWDTCTPKGYVCLSEGVRLLYICNKLTLRHKNGVYLYSSEILKIL